MAAQMSKMVGPDVRVKVTMDGDLPVHELWVGETCHGRVSFLWILETAMLFMSSLRFR